MTKSEDLIKLEVSAGCGRYVDAGKKAILKSFFLICISLTSNYADLIAFLQKKIVFYAKKRCNTTVGAGRGTRYLRK